MKKKKTNTHTHKSHFTKLIPIEIVGIRRATRLRPPSFIMRPGVGLEDYHLMLAFKILACLVNLKVAFGHQLLQ